MFTVHPRGNSRYTTNQYESFAQQVTNDSVPTVSDGTLAEKSLIRIMFCVRKVSEGLDDDGCKRIQHFLIEFSVCCISKEDK